MSTSVRRYGVVLGAPISSAAMTIAAVVLGVVVVAVALVDLVNSLVNTGTSYLRWWPSRILAATSFSIVRRLAGVMSNGSRRREALLSAFGPLLVLELLAMWVALQVFGFALIWWGIGSDGESNISGLEGLGDAVYYSGVVFFTVGFGEIVPSGLVPRSGALLEALTGVATTALVIGYLPSLYSAYSQREQVLMSLDDGSGERITPTSLVLAWAPSADPADLDRRFAEWEGWVTGIHETHASLPMLSLFRSHDPRQNWVTALGVLCDAAVQAQLIVGSSDRSAYWFLRRADALFREMTPGVDLTEYEARSLAGMAENELEFFVPLYRKLEEHGFELIPYDDALAYGQALRAEWAPRMEYLIDWLMCPRGFWSAPSQIRRADEFGRLGRHAP